MLTWDDFEDVLPGVIRVRREFINFTEPQLDDSLENKNTHYVSDMFKEKLTTNH